MDDVIHNAKSLAVAEREAERIGTCPHCGSRNLKASTTDGCIPWPFVYCNACKRQLA
jgi:hypothetical protein